MLTSTGERSAQHRRLKREEEKATPQQGFDLLKGRRASLKGSPVSHALLPALLFLLGTMLSTLTTPHRHKHTQPTLLLNGSHPFSTCPQAVCRLAVPSPEEAGDGWAGNFARPSDSEDLLSSSSTCLSGENTELSPPNPLWVPGRAQTSSSILVRGRLSW